MLLLFLCRIKCALHCFRQCALCKWQQASFDAQEIQQLKNNFCRFRFKRMSSSLLVQRKLSPPPLTVHGLSLDIITFLHRKLCWKIKDGILSLKNEIVNENISSKWEHSVQWECATRAWNCFIEPATVTDIYGFYCTVGEARQLNTLPDRADVCPCAKAL
jgi:hypothetical protein